MPLGDGAMTILEKMAELRSGDSLFPGQAAGRPRSNMTINVMQRRMKRDDLTVRSFRSTFRDWAAECTTFPAEVAEMALAHSVSEKGGGDLPTWRSIREAASACRGVGRLCCAPADNVVELQAAR